MQYRTCVFGRGKDRQDQYYGLLIILKGRNSAVARPYHMLCGSCQYENDPRSLPKNICIVARSFRQSIRRNSRKHLTQQPVSREGQGELRGKEHRNNRCEASAACEDHQLHPHKERPNGLTWMFHELLSRYQEGGRATGSTNADCGFEIEQDQLKQSRRWKLKLHSCFTTSWDRAKAAWVWSVIFGLRGN